MRGQSKVVPLEKLRFSKLSHCFPIDSALCSLAEPQTQERALSGSNYCTTQPKWQMNKCHNTTACSLPLCANSLTHTHTHTQTHARTPFKTSQNPFVSLSLMRSHKFTQSFTAGSQSHRSGEMAATGVHIHLWGDKQRHTKKGMKGGWES